MQLATLDFLNRELTADFLFDRGVEDVAEQSRFLQFALGEYQLLFPLEKLQEIFSLNLSQVTAVPELASFVMGIYNWRGNLAWLIDLQELLTGTPTIWKENVLCLLTPLKEQYLGIIVEKVGGISSFFATEIHPIVPGMIEPIGSNFLQGYFLDAQDQPYFVLNPQGIIDSFVHL